MSPTEQNRNLPTQIIYNNKTNEVPRMDDETQRNELRIEATCVGKSSQYDVSCRVGADLIHQDQFSLAKARERARFARDTIAKLGDGVPILATDIEGELLSVFNSHREATAASASPNDSANVADAGEELDVSSVLRPELVLQEGLSAIAIPRMVRRGGRVEGQWVHYVQQVTTRRLDILSNELRVGGGETTLLSPLPCEPCAGDVKNLNRWAADSRHAWLNNEPAPTTAEVLEMVKERIDRYIVLPLEAADAHLITLAAWVLMTYAYPALAAIPFLYLAGPAGSGKSRTMDVIARMVFRPLMTSNASAATIFRTRHAHGGTLLFDEAERLRDTRSPDVCEVLSILLAGYRRGGSATRMEPHGDSYRATSFDCYGPVVLGCIRGLPGALSSRCITVKMMRASKTDPQSCRFLDDMPEQESRVRDALHCWALEQAHRVMTATVEFGSLANRDAELWGPLLKIVADANDQSAFDLLQQHAEQMSEVAASDSQPEYDEVVLRAYYELRTEGLLPTAGEVLERGKVIDSESLDDGWKPKGVSTILKKYFAMKKSNGRKVYRDTPEAIREIALLYGYDMDGGKNDAE
jgi:hypothetical protein